MLLSQSSATQETEHMAHTTDPPSPPVTIPDPERIRDRLSALFAEARLLRRLLRVAVDARQVRIAEPADRQEVARD
jgi:hypothetical protein